MKFKLKVAIILFTIILTITSIMGIVAHQKKVNAKITREDVIEEFKANKIHFENVKQYMMTRSENYSIKLTSIKDEISDEKTIESVRYLVENKGYNRSIRNEIYRNNKKIVVFIKPGNNCDEFKIIYTNHYSNKEHFCQMQDLGDGWILSYMAYDCFGEDIISDCAKRLIAIIVCLAMVIVTIMVVSISKQRTQISEDIGNNQYFDTCFVVDGSGSMSGNSIITAKDSMIGFNEAMHYDDRVAIVGFDSTARVHLPFICTRDEAVKSRTTYL